MQRHAKSRKQQVKSCSGTRSRGTSHQVASRHVKPRNGTFSFGTARQANTSTRRQLKQIKDASKFIEVQLSRSQAESKQGQFKPV